MISDEAIQAVLNQMLTGFQVLSPTPPEPGQLVTFKLSPDAAPPLQLGGIATQALELTTSLASEAHGITGDITGTMPIAPPVGPITTGPADLTADLTSAAHPIVGTITGNLPLSLVSSLLPKLSLTWRVEKTNGADLPLIEPGDPDLSPSEGPAFIAPDGIHGPSLPIAFVPRFVSLEDLGNSNEPGLDRVRIFVDVELSVTRPPLILSPTVGSAETTMSRSASRRGRAAARGGVARRGPLFASEVKARITLGPIEVVVPRIPVPTVLLLTVDSQFQDAALLMVPAGSPLGTLEEVLGLLRPLHRVLGYLRSVARLASFFLGIDLLVDVLSKQPRIGFTRANKIDNLNNITLIQNSWYENDIEAEDELSSLLFVGKPGKKVVCSKPRNQKKKDGFSIGQFEVVLGPLMWAGIRTLHSVAPKCEPKDSVVNVIEPVVIPSDPFHPPIQFRPGTFGDCLSSLKFV